LFTLRTATLGATAIFMMAGLTGLSSIGNADASSVPVPKATPACTAADVHMAASTNHSAYPPGKTVVMTSSVTNVSRAACLIDLGADPGLSPVFNVTNAKGITVWNRCWVDDEPGACFEIVFAHVLNPGKTYSQRASWNQRSGPDGGPVKQVPPGKYTFTTAYVNLPQTPSAKFGITAGGAQQAPR
jgi:hypothetical protein